MLKLNDIAKTFNPGTVNEKKALDGVNLHLAPGDFVTVVGSNGAGKSTLFHAIAGVFVPDRGSIVLGVDYSHTYSCYKGGERHCGKCGTCTERREAMLAAGLTPDC